MVRTGLRSGLFCDWENKSTVKAAETGDQLGTEGQGVLPGTHCPVMVIDLLRTEEWRATVAVGLKLLAEVGRMAIFSRF